MQRSPVPVLQSKIRVPALPQVCIARPQLEDPALAEPDAPSRRLVYLSAPPGYGKTTLLSCISRRFCGTTVWFSLDPLDNDTDRLADHLAAALRLAGVGDRNDTDDDAVAAGGGSERLMRLMYALQDFGEPLLLVFDDAHVVHDESVFDALRAFVAYQPDNCRIAIASREDLPLRLYAHRQSDRLVELRAAQLRATDGEARTLLAQMGVELEPAALTGVLRKTAGWWSCLKLFAISWKQRLPKERERFLERFRGTDRFIAEFLLESLVSAFSPEISDAASVMAVPDFFNEALYTRLLGRDDYHLFVEQLQRINVLGSRPGEGTARYRFHPLLRDYLRHRVPRARRAELHRTTARWYAENRFHDRASRQLQLAESLERGLEGPPAGLQGLPVDEPRAEGGQPRTAECEGRFSRRERELLQALSHGLSNDEIAAQLFISTGTVKWHLNNIYAKLGAKSRTDAVHKARIAGLLVR